MRNYTTKTAALKATTIDTRALNAKRIDTDKIFINGESLEDVILQTSPKGINNAVKISTTLGSVLGNDVTVGEYVIGGGTAGYLYVENYNNPKSFTPVAVILNSNLIHVSWMTHDAGYNCKLWEDGDNLSELYGGINDDTMIEVLIVIHEQQDGDEPVQTSLTGAVQHNVVYHLGEEANLNLTLPTSLIANYAAEVVFTSGATPTVVTSDSRIKWVGDDVNAGVFTPVSNVRYSCSLQYDGVFVRGMAFGIPTV